MKIKLLGSLTLISLCVLIALFAAYTAIGKNPKLTVNIANPGTQASDAYSKRRAAQIIEDKEDRAVVWEMYQKWRRFDLDDAKRRSSDQLDLAKSGSKLTDVERISPPGS